MKDPTLIIPAYNEEDSIPVFLPAVAEFCKRNETLVIIVNDGSVDKTKAFLDANYLCKNFYNNYKGKTESVVCFGDPINWQLYPNKGVNNFFVSPPVFLSGNYFSKRILW